MRPYVIRQGDYLTKLAARLGFDVDEVWNDSKNDDLRERRGHFNVLQPGDVIYIPDAQPQGLPISSGGTHRYKATIPAVKLSMIIRGETGPIANEPYHVEGIGGPGQRFEGTSDGDGKVEFSVPVRVREVRLVFPERKLSYPVLVGDLDPIGEMSGIRQRLEHLGYSGWYGSGDQAGGDLGDQEARDRRMIAAFQADHDLEVTGKLDDDTKKAIEDAHGS